MISPPSPPAGRRQLTEPEIALILAVAADRVRATVLGQQTNPESQLGELGTLPVSGAFVSLKRGEELRSCCGLFGETVPLAAALQRSAMRAACEDPRFPPIAAGELDDLEIEVWLLYVPEEILVPGRNRLLEVEVGRHGLQVLRGRYRGLLLPSVPIKHGWDAEQFLRHTCVKAGLNPNLWEDPNTRVFRFEGDVYGARMREV